MATLPQDLPPWYQPCLNTIAQLGGQPCGTDLSHCNSGLIPNYVEAICSCGPGYLNGCLNNPSPNCCSYTAASPVPILSENCYCCCGCMANQTPVAASATEYKAIEDFALSDPVYVADDVSLQSWSQRPVAWSSGTGPGTNTMIKVTFGNGSATDYLIVNRAQPFLMPDRTLKLAAKLVPGTDALVTQSGEAQPVISLEIGAFNQGLHHIATTSTAATSPDGHLLLAKGIVCGDWALQVSLSTATAEALSAAPDHLENPEVGTRAYQEAHPDLEHTASGARAPGSSPGNPTAVSGFTPFGYAGPAAVPANAPGFLTQDQAWELEQNVQQIPPTSDAGQDLVTYLFKYFSGFYPDLILYLDNENSLPNAYAFEEYGRQVIVLTGGLLRTPGVGFETLAFVLARGIATFDATPPLNDDGYTCTGQADYGAIAAVLPQLWLGLHSVPIITAATQQVTALFKAIHKNRGGTNTCMGLSLDCRLQAMQAAFDMLPLPNCAGGPPDPALQVTSATGVTGDPHGQVTVSYDLPVDPTTAQELGNYAFNPLIDTYAVEMAPGDPTSVVITADVVEKVEYTVQVSDVLSIEQQPLQLDHNSATFTAGSGS